MEMLGLIYLFAYCTINKLSKVKIRYYMKNDIRVSQLVPVWVEGHWHMYPDPPGLSVHVPEFWQGFDEHCNTEIEVRQNPWKWQYLDIF